MGKRLLAGFLAVAMMMTMAPFAFAADETSDAVAKIGDKTYTTLRAAVDAVQNGQTIQLLQNATTDKLTDGVTYDLNGKTLTYTDKSGLNITDEKPTSFVDTSVSGSERGGTLIASNNTAQNASFIVNTGAVFNASNIRIESSKGEGIFPRGDAAEVNITNCDMKANWYCVGTNAATTNNYNVVINLKGSTFTACDTTYNDGAAVYINVAGTLNIDGCMLTSKRQGVMVRAGTANIANSTLTTTGLYSKKDQYYTGKWGSGNEVPAAALIVGNYFDGAATSYTADAVVTVENTKLIAENDFPALYVDGNTAYKGNVSISGEDTVVSGDIIKGQQTAEGAVNIAVAGGTYSDLATAVECATDGATIKLAQDVDLAKTVVVSNKNITLDLNGKKLYNTKDIWSDDDWSLVSVQKGGNLTITGNGTLAAKENDCYAVDVQEGATVTIENGTLVGNIHAVYVTEGTAYIKGGTYSVQQKYFPDPDGTKAYEFVLNLLDSARRDGTAKMIVTGGTFVKFNPANCQAEGAGTNFLASGYVTKQVGDNYVVKANDNKNIDDLDKAIEVIKKDDSQDADVKAAVSVIENIDNADLASSSAAMSKLAELDSQLTDSTGGKPDVEVVKTVQAEKINEQQVTVTNAAVSANLTANEPKVTVEIKDITVNQEKLGAVKQEVLGDTTSANEVMPLEINLKDEDGNKIHNPVAPVIIEFPLPEGWAGCKLVYVDEDTIESIPTTVINGMVRATFVHFSNVAAVQTNAVENPNEYQIELTPTDGETEVYAGDTITFNVILKQKQGDSTEKISTLQFIPQVNEAMLALNGATTASGVQYSADSGFTLTSWEGTTIPSNGLQLGTLTCKVKGYNSTNTPLDIVAVNDAVAGKYSTVTNVKGYNEGSYLTVAPINVTYNKITVTFRNYDANGKENDDTYVTRKGSNLLYRDVSKMEVGTSVTAPQARDGSNGEIQYRLRDKTNNLNNWITNGNPADHYSTSTTFNSDAFYYVDRVQLLKVEKLPTGVEITDNLITERNGTKYVDYNKDLVFTVGPTDTGMKNEVTVEVGGQAVDASKITESNGTYTVEGDAMNASPVKISVNQVIDLNENDIKIFDNGQEGAMHGFMNYSAASGTDTLVLIKGKSGVKYTLNATDRDNPEIFAIPNKEYDTTNDTGYTLAVLLPAPTADDMGGAAVEVRSAYMLNYLTNVYKIAVTQNDSNTAIEYDWNTNGKPGPAVFDAQATYNFSSMKIDDFLWDVTDELLLKADVLTYIANATPEYSEPRDGRVTQKDVEAFLYLYAGFPRPADSSTGN